jgi:transcriptional regulator with XRE-family HTH domain
VSRRRAENIVRFAVAELAKKRVQLGVSYEDLGGLTGLHPTALARIERNERRPTAETLYLVALALEISLARILAGAERQTAHPADRRAARDSKKKRLSPRSSDG